MTVYVQRDGAGAITGVYANPQPGYAEEAADDAGAEVVAWVAAIAAGPTLAARRATAGNIIQGGGDPQYIANRAADATEWTHGRNNVAECLWAALTLVCQRANVAVPTTVEIAAQITATRTSDPGVTAADVADQGKRRLTQAEIVPLISSVLSAGGGDPLPPP